MNWIIAHQVELIGFALFLWSEVLGSSEKFKNSSVFEIVLNILKSLKKQ